MKLILAIVMVACSGCGGGGSGGADGGGGSGGADGGGTPTPCTLSISGDVTSGTYRDCILLPAPQGTHNKVQIDGFVLPGCNDCRLIVDFSQTPTESCSGSGAMVQVEEPSRWPDAIGMAATSTGQMASCTITTTQLDLAGKHWSGSIDAFLVATDFSFNTVGFARVTVTGGF